MTLVTNGPANFVPYRYTYANAAARTSATGFVAADVGSWAVQLDDGTVWELTATTPTWAQRGGGGTVAAHATSHQVGGSDAFTGIVPGSAFAPSGLTGATALSRYVGATASGAPASGTFAVGDFVIDQTGKIWLCTTAGTPGTWTQVGGGSSGALTLIATATLAVDTASVTFSSIPGTYRHLELRYQARETGAIGVDNCTLRFNGDSGANYDTERFSVVGGGSAANDNVGATVAYIGQIPGSTAAANLAGVALVSIFNYAATTFQKEGVSNQGTKIGTAAGNNYTGINHFAWRNAAAITQIDLLPSAGNFLAGSMFSLYGVS